jgi:aromatic-amino-acid transaminase
MNAPHSPSLLSSVPLAPSDPILGVTEAYVADPNPRKVNLGVGVYYDDAGKIPLLECVRHAESERLKAAPPRGYLPIDGIAAYDRAVQELVFGAKKDHIVTVQALGGTGGLKVGADFLKRISPLAEIWISEPSWENHRQLFEAAGFTVKSYPYYDAKTHGLDFPGMRRALSALPAGAVAVLHACCHNPTGVDLAPEQWSEVLDIVTSRGIVPFIDLAYQGFGEDLAADAHAARLFAGATSPVFLSSSFSKSFSLYGERVGALSIVTASAEEATRVLSQLKSIVRTNYSNPPTHGGQLVATVLNNPQLRSLWERELAEMRDRIKLMRKKLVETIRARASGADFSFVLAQRGMFSYSGLTKEQVRRLREEYSIYAIDTGRICVAALNSKNVDYVADAIAKVIK